MTILRDYQHRLEQDVYTEYTRLHQQGMLRPNLLAVLPTGGGKTVIFSDVVNHQAAPQSLVAQHPELMAALNGRLLSQGKPVCVIAHRSELVGQIANALARNGVRYRIIAPPATIRNLVSEQVRETGTNYYSPQAAVAVAGVDTLLRQKDKLAHWLNAVGLWVIDEAHHVLRKNKWGKAVALFPNAWGLGVTATPVRADGHGLGADYEGVFHTLVLGPTMRRLINDGWLTDYRIFCPKSDIDLSDVSTGADGDFNKAKLKTAVRQSRIVGDVVENYQRIAPGKRAVVFATDVETATDIAQRFKAAGTRAEVVHGGTKAPIRNEIIRRFRKGEVDVLVNVDLFGEGFDLPAIEVVIFARPTESFSLFCQQFGRALRVWLEGTPTHPDTPEGRKAAIASSRKPCAIIIDHVGNVVRHGLPDAARGWSLASREKRSNSASGPSPLVECLNPECLAPYERFLPACPFCGHSPEPTSRRAPEFVDGDLTELDPDVLAQMRGDVAQVDMPAEKYRDQLVAKRCPAIALRSNLKYHEERQEAQAALRASVAWWAAHHRDAGRSDKEAYRRFFLTFGVDVLTAQALNVRDGLELADRVNAEIVRQLSDER